MWETSVSREAGWRRRPQSVQKITWYPTIIRESLGNTLVDGPYSGQVCFLSKPQIIAQNGSVKTLLPTSVGTGDDSLFIVISRASTKASCPTGFVAKWKLPASRAANLTAFILEFKENNPFLKGYIKLFLTKS